MVLTPFPGIANPVPEKHSMLHIYRFGKQICHKEPIQQRKSSLLVLVKFCRDELDKLAPGFVFLKFSPECGGGGNRILFLNAAHHHAKM